MPVLNGITRISTIYIVDSSVSISTTAMWRFKTLSESLAYLTVAQLNDQRIRPTIP